MAESITGFRTLFDDLVGYRKFRGKNTLKSSRSLFEARKHYNSFAYYELNLDSTAHNLQRTNGGIPKPVVNFQDMRKIYYGKIDYLGNPIVLRKLVDKEGSRVSAETLLNILHLINLLVPYLRAVATTQFKLLDSYQKLFLNLLKTMKMLATVVKLNLKTRTCLK